MISKSQIDRAGDKLRSNPKDSAEYKEALSTVENWRRAHDYPLKTFKSNLDKRLRKYPGSISAQRLKRMPTLLDKLLKRQAGMRLSAMQDIGGIRAVVRDTVQAEKLAHEYRNSKRFPHILKTNQCKNYIETPKEDGYRGIHLVYEYNNTLARTQAAKESRGMLVEIQIRSELQHVWATAIETVGLMTGQSLKNQQGDDDWLVFFKYISSVFAIIENRNVLAEHKGQEQREIYRSVISMIERMQIFDKLQGYSAGLQIIDRVRRHHYYHLLTLNTHEKIVNVRGYTEAEYEKAVEEYEAIESQHNNHIDVVLVSAGQRKELKKAYPNYYLDLKKFVKLLKLIVIEYESIK